jgi:hypothetical protein
MIEGGGVDTRLNGQLGVPRLMMMMMTQRSAARLVHGAREPEDLQQPEEDVEDV